MTYTNLFEYFINFGKSSSYRKRNFSDEEMICVSELISFKLLKDTSDHLRHKFEFSDDGNNFYLKSIISDKTLDYKSSHETSLKKSHLNYKLYK